jgi:hypothetical protein
MGSLKIWANGLLAMCEELDCKEFLLLWTTKITKTQKIRLRKASFSWVCGLFKVIQE